MQESELKDEGLEQQPVAEASEQVTLREQLLKAFPELEGEPAVVRYPASEAVWDYAKASFGLVFSAVLLSLTAAHWLGLLVFGGLLLLFAIYGLNAFKRHKSSFAISADGVASRSMPAVMLRWDDVGRVALRYYGKPLKQKSEPVDRAKGVMVLTLEGRRDGQGKPLKMAFESSIENFEGLLRLALLVARAAQLELDATTLANVSDLGLDEEQS
ncbi:hypothetical protein [Kiloniella sp. b19]|uniref:hypothetical protein n=1 Tax=Kiloniella sp. GXU_MW_B19 TaxID=3141326 RepID=UPI0031DF408B